MIEDTAGCWAARTSDAHYHSIYDATCSNTYALECIQDTLDGYNKQKRDCRECIEGKGVNSKATQCWDRDAALPETQNSLHFC